MNMADEKYFDLEIISPERTFYKGQVHFLELTTSEGEVGIYKNHIPMTNVVVPGIVTIHEADGVKEAALHSGFMVILQDSVKIMAEVAEWPDEIDVNRAEAAKDRAEERIANKTADIDVARAEFALRKALIRIDLAGYR